MNKPLLTCFLLLTFLIAKAQTQNTDVPDVKIETQRQVDTPKNAIYSRKIVTAVQREPGFPGGPTAFFSFLQHNIIYPPNAVKKKIEGKVYLSFVVEKDGTLTHVEVLRGVSPDIDAEAIRVISHSPKWKPGLQNSMPVREPFDIAINFKLPSSTTNTQQVDTVIATQIDSNKKFVPMAKEPGFPGGTHVFFLFIAKNLRYPEQARLDNIQGEVIISFIVEKDGSLSNIDVAKSLSKETDAEAVRLIKSSPKWRPGFQNGYAIRVPYTVPVTFKLSN